MVGRLIPPGRPEHSPLLPSIVFYFTFGSAVTILFSIALSQLLLGVALALLLLSPNELRFPPIRLPLAIFFGITVAALIASPDPAAGIPQIRKFYIFAIVLAICSTFKTVGQVRALIFAWAGAGALSALVGLEQFAARWQEALRQHADYYSFYLDRRITGFAGHWMTFGGQEMIVLLMLAACVLFSTRRTLQLVGWPIMVLLAAAIVLGMTRCIFLLGAPAGLAYLLWRRRALVLAALLASGIGVVIAPHSIQERIASVAKPHQDLDSNAHRAVCRAVGWQMIEAHPWLGLGPEQIGRQFERYIPASIHRPLPIGWYGHLHNIYLQYAAERGIFGLAAILWLIAKVSMDFYGELKGHKLTPGARHILHGGIAVIVAVLAEGFFEYNLGDSEVLTLFLCVIACGYVVIRHERERSREYNDSARLTTDSALLTNPLHFANQIPAGRS